MAESPEKREARLTAERRARAAEVRHPTTEGGKRNLADSEKRGRRRNKEDDEE